MRRFTMFIALVFAGVLPLVAQQRGPMRGPGVERVEQLKKLRMIEALKLGEETSVRFIGRYNAQMDDLRNIGTRRSGLIDELQGLVRANAADADIDAKVKEIAAEEQKVGDVRQKFLLNLRDILTPKQIAQYIVFERNFNQDLRDILRETSQDRMRRREQ